MSATPKWLSSNSFDFSPLCEELNRTSMFFFAKGKEDSSSSPDSSTGKPPPLLRRKDTFGSAELFEAWAKDSFINQSTIDILVKTHQIDCLPAVLALKKEDYPQLSLPVGQRRLLEEAVDKLRQEYELVRPPTPKAIINLEMPVYKSMLEIGELAEEETGASEVDDGSAGRYEEIPASRAQSGNVSQRKSGQARSYVESGTDKRDSGPEKEALLDTEQSTTSPQTAQRRKGLDYPSCLSKCLLIIYLSMVQITFHLIFQKLFKQFFRRS